VPLLKDLLRVFGEAFDEVDTYLRSAPSDDYLTRLLSKQHFIAVVAMKSEEVVGGLAAYELDRLAAPGQIRTSCARESPRRTPVPMQSAPS